MNDFYYEDDNLDFNLINKDYKEKILPGIEKVHSNVYENFNIITKLSKTEENRRQLQNENWFHGAITRETSESLLKIPGDFLVRESNSLPGQIVLSCYNGSYIHVTLTDSDGNLRSAKGRFKDVKDLIEYYYFNKFVISELVEYSFYLLHPIISL
ncbi:hypothetical protein PVAND_011955 [Polypedilum vanderplanki]|uniref:SH2 domain-containing protein n=1 Tax=Polypedilum vanderplanki TaxID=319348 RepID=A0A9J6CKV9_POLVA|nr:hypothetical protein PVAND_011955 [Polypedilum vanderplanki]